MSSYDNYSPAVITALYKLQLAQLEQELAINLGPAL